MEKPDEIKINSEKGNFEKLPATPEEKELEPVKTPEQEINEINQQVSETEALIEKERKELDEARMMLGLPDMGEESASIKAYKEKINGLLAKKTALEKTGNPINFADKTEEGGAKPEKIETKESLVVEKINSQEFNDFVAAAEGVARILRERDSQRLDRLTDDPGRITGSVSSLKAALSSRSPDVEGIGRSISRIAECINELGESQSRGAVKDNPESLGRLAFLLDKIDKERHVLGARIIKKEGASNILASLGRIESAARNKKAAMQRKLNFLKEYGGRRF